jgi:hypothetical protein
VGCDDAGLRMTKFVQLRLYTTIVTQDGKTREVAVGCV